MFTAKGKIVLLLAADIGNTNIHLGLWNGESWALNWRARTVADKMPDEYGVLVRNFLTSADVAFDAVSGVIISSVVPPLTASFTELARRYFKLEPVVVTHATNTGVKIDIDQPEQAGADRIVNAAAVVGLHGGGPALVIDSGTATTFDVIDRHGAYCGGAICPGIGVAHDALVSRAAKLHKVDLLPPPSAIGRNTIHAMQSGIFYGYVAMIEGLASRIKAQMRRDDPLIVDESAIRVFATGGLSAIFKEHSTAIDIIEPELTLDGLRVIYALNKGA
jgi:type III pantothenate kinase